jgi:hypothetical protein
VLERTPKNDLSEPITVAEWWKNRLRTCYSEDGRLKPGKGFAAEVRQLPRLAAAIAKAEAKARELRLISSDDGGEQ